jgi:Caspase domain
MVIRLIYFGKLILLAILLYGCLSAPVIYPPKKAPVSVRSLEFLRVYPGRGTTFSGVELFKDDIVSAVVSGKIRFGRDGREHGPYVLRAWIGDNIYGSPFTVVHGTSFSAPNTGKLYFAVGDGSYLMNSSGFFDLTIVVWRTKSYAAMVPFLEVLKSRAENKDAFQEAIDQAMVMVEIESAKKETIGKIESSKTELAGIQHDRSKDGLEGAQKTKKIEGLQERLQLLTNKVAELDELSSQLQNARSLTAELKRRLQAFEQKEKELNQKLLLPYEHPPQILVSSPEQKARYPSSGIRLVGVVEDANGIVQVDLFFNGRQIPIKDFRPSFLSSDRYPDKIDFDWPLLLQNGFNTIEIGAIGKTGLKGKKTITVEYTPHRNKAYAVVVGINDYSRLPKLKYAVNDAREFYRLLTETNGIPAHNITLLLNEEATIKNLRSALGTGLRAAAGPDDMVIIFFAGHGTAEADSENQDGDGLEKYLIAYDTQPDDLYSTAIPMREISYIFKRIKSNRLIFISDACYSGAAGGRTVNITGVRSRIEDEFLARIVQGNGKIIITASAANEVSVEKDDLQHGVFTYYLIEALKGAADTDRDGAVTVDEAYRYVSEKVPHATGQEQHPVKKGFIEGSLILSVPHEG